MTVEAYAHINAWDSTFFGFKIAHTTDPDMRREAESIWALVEPGDPKLKAFVARGFTLADIRVTLERSDQVTWMDAPVGPAVPDDHERLAEIARTAHRGTRYYNAGYDPDRCDALYETWMRNSLDGWADVVLTSGEEGDPTGYITLHIDRNVAKIGLFAVREDMRGKGIGRSLVLGAIDRAQIAGAIRATVVTQGANVPAIRLYEGCGFKTSSTELWLHRWVR